MELVLHPNLSPFIHFLELLLCSEKCLRITRKSVNNRVITHWYFKPQKLTKSPKILIKGYLCSKSFSWGDNPIVNMIFCVGSNLATWSCLIINEKKSINSCQHPFSKSCDKMTQKPLTENFQIYDLDWTQK